MNEISADIQLFWAGLFFTCFLGIMRLFPELENWSRYNGRAGLAYKVSIFILYFGLLGFMLLSVERFLNLYELRITPSPIIDFPFLKLGKTPLLLFVIIPMLIIFVILFCVKTKACRMASLALTKE